MRRYWRSTCARFPVVGLLLLAGCLGRAAGQEIFQQNGDVWPVVPMSPARAEDAYAIYSLLTPQLFPDTALQHHPLWLIADTTLVVASDLEDPRTAIIPPPQQRQAFASVLQDYAQHRYEHVHLDRNFHLDQPYRLLDPTQASALRTALLSALARQSKTLAAPFQGALGLVGFSNVYFNFEHTLAMVYVVGWCGPKCGQMRWIILQKVNDGWNVLPWRTTLRVP
jgi:hypothetical protein